MKPHNGENTIVGTMIAGAMIVGAMIVGAKIVGAMIVGAMRLSPPSRHYVYITNFPSTGYTVVDVLQSR